MRVSDEYVTRTSMKEDTPMQQHHGDFLSTPAGQHLMADLSANQLQFDHVLATIVIVTLAALAVAAFFEEFTVTKRRT